MNKILLITAMVLISLKAVAQNKIVGLHEIAQHFSYTSSGFMDVPECYISLHNNNDTIYVKLGNHYFKMRFTDTLFSLYDDGTYDLRTKDTVIHFRIGYEVTWHEANLQRTGCKIKSKRFCHMDSAVNLYNKQFSIDNVESVTLDSFTTDKPNK